MALDPKLLEILACPKCKGELEYEVDGEQESLICRTDGLRYEVQDDIPIMLIDEAKPL